MWSWPFKRPSGVWSDSVFRICNIFFNSSDIQTSKLMCGTRTTSPWRHKSGGMVSESDRQPDRERERERETGPSVHPSAEPSSRPTGTPVLQVMAFARPEAGLPPPSLPPYRLPGRQFSSMKFGQSLFDPFLNCLLRNNQKNSSYIVT